MEPDRYLHQDDLMPGPVASAVAYRSSGLPRGEHRGLPSPWITFIVSVGAPVRVMGMVDSEDHFDPTRATAYDVVVAGLHPVAARVEQPEHQEGVQLAVHPLAAPMLFGCRAAELVGSGDHGHEVLGRAARELHERVGAAVDGEARLAAVQRWLLARVQPERRAVVRPEVVHAWQLLQRSGGRARIDAVAREVALSPRQLRELTTAELGLSPKQLARSFRFDAVIARLAAGEDNLAVVAAATGYADQSHLAREFRQMAGCPPSTWLREERRNLQDGGHRNRPG